MGERAVRILLVVLAAAITSLAPLASNASATSPVIRGEVGAPTPAQPPPDDVDPQAPPLQLESQSAFTDADGVFDLVLRADQLPPGSRLRVTVHSSVASLGRFRFEDTVSGRSLGSPILSLPLIDVDAARAFLGETIGVRIPVTPAPPAPEGGVVLGAPGVHPVAVDLTDADGAPLDSFVTYLIRLPAEDDDPGPALAFSTLLPFEAPPALGADRSWSIDPLDLARLGALADAVAATPDVPLTLVPLPETIAALEQVDGGRAVLDALFGASADSEVVASPWVPLDVGSWAAEGMGAQFASEIEVGTSAVTEASGSRPELGTAIVDPTVDPAGLALLNDVGTTRVVVPEDLLSPLDTDLFPVSLTQPFELRDEDGRPVAAVAADRGLVDRMEATDDPVLAAHLVLADLSVLRLDREGPQRGATMLLDDPSPEFLDTLLAGLAEPHALPLISATTLDEQFDRVPPASAAGTGSTGAPLVRTWTAELPEPLGDYPEERTAARGGLDGYRSLLGEDSTRWLPLEALLQSSGDRRLSAAERTELLTTVAGLIGDDTDAISIPDGQAITLTAEEGTLPIVIDNGLEVPVNVRLTLRSDRLELPDGEEVEARLVPGSNRVELRVQARASGAFPLDVVMTSPDGVLELEESRVEIRSTSISGLGLILSIGAGLFLAVWWARHFRTTRRARRLVSPDHPANVAAGGQGP